MIGYCMLGTNDVARAKAFYDPIVTLLGASVLAAYSSDNMRRRWPSAAKTRAHPVCAAPTRTDFVASISVIRMGTSSVSSASAPPDTEWREGNATRR